MARADLLKKLMQSYQQRDDRLFRTAADELIQEERRKHHPVLANELERILRNGSTGLNNSAIQDLRNDYTFLDSPPKDSDRKTSLLEIKNPDRYLNDLVLDEVIQKSVDRLLSEFSSWDVLQANGLSPVRRVLFCGPSGCGKTAVAEAIATELGLPLLYVRFDAVVSSLLGETAANLRKVFDYARRGQWVMLFDEFDAIGRSRDDVTEHGEIKRVVNSLLQIIDNFDGRSLIIAATNFEQALDPAIWRRFDDVIRFERPNNNQLKIVVKKRLAPLQFRVGHVEEIAKALSSATYADAERLCLDIRKSCAIRGDRKLQKEDIVEAKERHLYRQSVLYRAINSSTPSVDKE
jgi:SpoVK/Ycf46/Vps4 family AAA+-type ATPase